VAQSVRSKLPALLRPYYRNGRRMVKTAFGFREFHKFRLRTKRLRYTLEFFRFCYGPGLEERLAGLRQIQDYLGAISDCESVRELVAETLPAKSPDREALEAFLRKRARRKAAELRLYWRRIFDADGAELRWRNYLARPKKALES